MFKTVIPDAIKVAEAPSYSTSIFEHAPKGAAAKAYRNLIKEVLKRW